MKNQPNIRQNFYQGQSVSATNLNRLQDYSDNARDQIMSDILGYGIVSGFEVTKSETDNSTLLISSGLAYTEQGVRLQSAKILDTIQTLEIEIPESELPAGESTITKYLVISLDYIKSGDIRDNSQNLIQTKWTPTVKATLYLDKSSFTIDDLPIAEIIFDKSGIKTITQNGEKLFDFHDLHKTVTGNKEETDNNTSAIAKIDKTVTELTSTVSEVDKKVDENKKEIDGKVTDLTSTVSVADKKVNENKKEIDGKVTTLTSTVETNTSAITDLTNKTNDPAFADRVKLLIDQNGTGGTGGVESGSNDNGSYIKFSDGTMICSISGDASFTTWTFPAIFISTPIIICYQYLFGDWAALDWRQEYTLWENDFTATQLVTKVTDSHYIHAMKIAVMGRWKALPTPPQ